MKTKYRIVCESGRFYPEHKGLFLWKRFYNPKNFNRETEWFPTLEQAQLFIHYYSIGKPSLTRTITEPFETVQ
jgi:hypothetical protein